MDRLNNTVMSTEEQDEIKEIVSLFVGLPKEDRAILLANANAFRVRADIEKAKSHENGT